VSAGTSGSLIGRDCAAAVSDSAAPQSWPHALGPVLPGDRQPRRPGRVLAAGARPGRARPTRAAVGRRCPRAGLDGAGARRACRCWPGMRRRPAARRRGGRGLRLRPARRPSSQAHGARPAAAGVDQPRIPQRRGLCRAQPRPAVAQRPRRGADKWFFYPGFTPATGGLLREPGPGARRPPTGAAWLARARLGAGRASAWSACSAMPTRRCRPCCPRWPRPPTLLLATPGHCRRRWPPGRCCRRPAGAAPALAAQTDFDHLLAACDLNLVRGEDSSCAPMWAGGPVLWQIYPQTTARTRQAGRLARPAAGTGARRRWRSRGGGMEPAGTAGRPAPAVPAGGLGEACATAWRAGLLAQDDLVTQLLGLRGRMARKSGARIAGFAPTPTGVTCGQARVTLAAPVTPWPPPVTHGTPGNHAMKLAQEIRAGNVIMQGKDPMVVLKTEYSRGGRNAATVRMKMKNLLNGGGAEVVFKADDKMDQIILDKKECTYTYFADPMYVFMDASTTSSRSKPRTWATPSSTWKTTCRSKWCSTTARPSRSNCPPPWCAKITTDPGRQGRHLGQGAQAGQAGGHGLRDQRADLRRKRRQDRNRHPHARVPQARLISAFRAEQALVARPGFDPQPALAGLVRRRPPREHPRLLSPGRVIARAPCPPWACGVQGGAVVRLASEGRFSTHAGGGALHARAAATAHGGCRPC
jgi:translation elongation factor P/translation initiation factor 5A